MKEYVLWGQVQERLNRHMEKTGQPYSFYEAVEELWRGSQTYWAEELPKVSFEEWDIDNLEQLRELYTATPVDLDDFRSDFQQEHLVTRSTERIIQLDITPMILAQNQAMGLHRHDSFEVCYVMKGSAALHHGDSVEELPARAFCIVSPHTHHDVVSTGGSIVIAINFSEQTIEQTLYQLIRQENALSDFLRRGLSEERNGFLIFDPVPEPAFTHAMFRSIFHEYFQRMRYSYEACTSFLSLLFIHLLRSCGNRHEQNRYLSGSRGTLPILPILRYIQDNYKTTSLEEVSSVFHYSVPYLSKQIKANTGRKYTEIVNELRIGEARLLLRTTDLPVEKVGEQVGFSCSEHFSRRFKESEGCSPRAYRKKAGKTQ